METCIMLERITRKFVRAVAVAAFLILPAIASAGDVLLRVGGAVDKPLQLTRSDLRAMPRDQFQIPARHDRNVMETWSGVPMIEILRKAGAPVGDRLRGRNMAAYVVVIAADGFRAVYALAEIEPKFSPERRILVADTLDGQPLGGDFGNLRIANKGEGEFSRWVRQVVALEVRIAE
jgi:DMSO/TMAO reductase YedYZ molybdopterin-dependent catalytic subunit